MACEGSRYFSLAPTVPPNSTRDRAPDACPGAGYGYILPTFTTGSVTLDRPPGHHTARVPSRPSPALPGYQHLVGAEERRQQLGGVAGDQHHVLQVPVADVRLEGHYHALL